MGDNYLTRSGQFNAEAQSELQLENRLRRGRVKRVKTGRSRCLPYLILGAKRSYKRYEALVADLEGWLSLFFIVIIVHSAAAGFEMAKKFSKDFRTAMRTPSFRASK